MRLLIADGNPTSRGVLEEQLRQWGHEVVVACDGDEALGILQQEDAPPVAILDWAISGTNGMEVCRKLRQRGLEVRPYVILLATKARKRDVLAAVEAGAGECLAKPFAPDELKARLRAAERFLEMQTKLLEAEKTLREQMTRDPLTGLLNREAILVELRREFDRAPRTGLPVAVVMADLDHLKRINDTFGQAVADGVLVEAARRMAAEVRSYEAIGRYGGEEFLSVLSGCDLDGAWHQAERLRRAVSETDFDILGVRIPVTVSVGVASSCQLQNPDEELLIQVADVALHRAKSRGRDRVEAAEDIVPNGLVLSETFES